MSATGRREAAGLARHGRIWRVIEAFVACAALLVVAPLFVAIAVAIFINDRGSVLFVQRRIGRHGRPFPILKFRTMTAACGSPSRTAEPLQQCANDPRLTRVGRGLRRSHLDELPQLLNVIAGHMSLVGPRPLVPDEDALVSQVWHQRHEHRPGLTGAWQLHRSAQTSVEELIWLDRAYLANWSPREDLRLLVRTAHCVLKGSGR